MKFFFIFLCCFLPMMSFAAEKNLISLSADGPWGRIVNTQDKELNGFYAKSESYQLGLNYSRIMTRTWMLKAGGLFLYNRFDQSYMSPSTFYNKSTYFEFKIGPVLNFSFQDEDPGFMKSTFLGFYLGYGKEYIPNINYSHYFFEIELGQRFLLLNFAGPALSFSPSFSIREESIKVNQGKKIRRTSSVINFLQFDFVF